jgi:hypothetical protein
MAEFLASWFAWPDRLGLPGPHVDRQRSYPSSGTNNRPRVLAQAQAEHCALPTCAVRNRRRPSDWFAPIAA